MDTTIIFSMLFSDLLLETAGAIGNFSAAELFLIENVDIPAFPKTWIVCHGGGLTDGSIRTELKRGFQPWNAHARTLWVLNPVYTPIGILSVDEVKAEWRACMKYWISVIVENSQIEIFNHQENGINQLRVRLTKRMHFFKI